MFAAIATSHPLTPIVMTAALVGLVVFGVLRVRTRPADHGGDDRRVDAHGRPHATSAATRADIFSGFGSFGSNFSSNLVQLGQVDAAQRVVSQMGRIEVATIAVLALLGLARRIKRGHWDGAAIVLLVSPLVILVGGNYDGEALFRVFLFALPFAAFFVALLLFPDPDVGRALVHDRVRHRGERDRHRRLPVRLLRQGGVVVLHARRDPGRGDRLRQRPAQHAPRRGHA